MTSNNALTPWPGYTYTNFKDITQSELPHVAYYSVTGTDRGSLNEAAKLNASRPSQHPTDPSTRVNSMTSGKASEYTPSFELLRLDPSQTHLPTR